jgi:hypothetical protein
VYKKVFSKSPKPHCHPSILCYSSFDVWMLSLALRTNEQSRLLGRRRNSSDFQNRCWGHDFWTPRRCCTKCKKMWCGLNAQKSKMKRSFSNGLKSLPFRKNTNSIYYVDNYVHIHICKCFCHKNIFFIAMSNIMPKNKFRK